MLTHVGRRKVDHLMSKSVNVFKGIKSTDNVTHTESPLEADFCYHLEFDHNVVEYQAQPDGFYYHYEGKRRRYFPDFWVKYQNGTTSYFEVKYQEDVDRVAGFNEWFSAVESTTRRHGIGFFLITEDFIRQFPIYENLVNLWSSITTELDSSVLLKIISKFKNNSQISIADLIDNKTSSTEFELVHRLIFEQGLKAPINKELLSLNSLIQINEAYFEKYI